MAPPIVPLVVATALFMENTDATILSTALPTIARDLGLDPLSLKLAVTSYLVSLAVFIPVSGWVADRVGSCTTFRLALAVFMIASIGCAFSNSLGQFVFWRAVQGLGGAMMVPVGRMVVIRAVPKSELVQALAFIAMPALIGPMLGPPLGGLIVTYADWRWIFFVNIPIGILGIVLATLFIPEIKEETPPLDVRGFLLTATGFGGLLLGTAMMGRRIAPPEVAVGCIVGGLAALGLYVRHALSVPRPLLDLRLLRLRTFEVGIAGGVFFRLGVGASAFLLPLMLQLAFGLDALHSGLITFAGAFGALAVKPLARGFLRRFGFRRLLIVNGVLASAVLLASALFTPATPHLRDHRGAVVRRLPALAAVHQPLRHHLRRGRDAPGGLGDGDGERGAAGVGELRRGDRRHGGGGLRSAARAHGAGDGRLRGGVRGGRPDVDGLRAADAPPAGRCGG